MYELYTDRFRLAVDNSVAVLCIIGQGSDRGNPNVVAVLQVVGIRFPILGVVVGGPRSGHTALAVYTYHQHYHQHCNSAYIYITIYLLGT